MKTALRKLSIDDAEAVYAFLQSLPDENGYHNSAYGLSYAEFHTWLIQMNDYSEGRNMPDWMVPSSEYWFVVDDVIVGNIRLRHFLNDALRNGGGHIGYAIAPEYRGKGYAKLMLKEMIKEAKQCYKLDEILITAHIHNIASRKTIEACGGQLEKEADNQAFYWIKC